MTPPTYSAALSRTLSEGMARTRSGRVLLPPGLINLGNTCYMNAGIQCLVHTPWLRSYFTTGAWRNDLNTKVDLTLTLTLSLSLTLTLSLALHLRNWT